MVVKKYLQSFTGEKGNLFSSWKISVQPKIYPIVRDHPMCLKKFAWNSIISYDYIEENR